MGTVGIAAGQQVLFKDSGADQRVFVQAPGGDITNSGAISAAQAEIRSNGGNIYAIAGNNNTGAVRATGTTVQDGHVWLVADHGTANVSSAISAQNADGTGGAVETSGEHLNIAGANVSTGKGGNWLLDPVDLTIDSSAASSIDTALASSNVTVSTSATGSSGFGSTVSGNGDINVANSISWSSGNSLTLSAYRNINVETGATISNSGSGSLTLYADNAATETGTVSFTGTGAVNFGSSSGNVNIYYHPTSYPTATSYSSNVTMHTGTLTSYMTVDSMTDLQHVNNNLSGTYALNTDLNATGVSFTQIADGSDQGNPSDGFSGVFEGQGHTISHLTPTIDGSENSGGLFNQISSTGIVRNLGLVNVTVNGGSGQWAGGLTGENYGTIENSYTTGSVSAAGSCCASPLVGGLVGNNDGTIWNTWSSATVSGGKIVGPGGLVGYNGWNYATYNSGTPAKIYYSYSVGAVSAGLYGVAGGFAGENDGRVYSSYFDSVTSGQTTGIPDIGGGGPNQATGVSTTTFQNGNLPSGLSSSNWTAYSGYYPRLNWQPSPGITVSGVVYNGASTLSGVTVDGLAGGSSFGSATSGSGGAFSFTAPANTTSVLLYLAGGTYTGNTFSNLLTGGAFTGTNIYNGQLRLINNTQSSYSLLSTSLLAALGSNSGSTFLFTNNAGVITPTSGTALSIINTASGFNVDQPISASGSVLINSSGNLSIAGSNSIASTASGDAVTLVTGGTFTNNAGANVLTTSNGRWLLWGTNGGNTSLGGLSYGFKQYNATYGTTTVAGTGNGLLYGSISPVTVSLTGSVSKTYDGLASATLSSSNYGFSNVLSGDTVTASGTATYASANAGSNKTVDVTGLTLSATDGTGAMVYGYTPAFTSINGPIGTINPATLTYTANTASRTYGSSNPALSGSVTGFVGTDSLMSATTGTLSFASPATSSSNAGSYAINGSGLSATNYTFQQAAGNATALTVNPATLTYTANPASKTYGSANPSLSGSVTGFVNGDTENASTSGTLAFSSSAATGTGVGSYAINGSGLSAANYTFQQDSGNATALTINPATLTYVASAASKTYGSANPSLSGSVSGFVNGDTLGSSTSGALAFTTAATVGTGVGSYAVNGSGLSAANYAFQQDSGNATALTINPATLTYVASAASKTYGSANPSLSGSVTGFVNGDTQNSATAGTLAFTTAATVGTGVGAYAINGSGLTAGNYTFQQDSGNATALTINPALLTYVAMRPVRRMDLPILALPVRSWAS